LLVRSPVNTAFVTGGSGFLGINLVRFLLEKVWTVVSFDLEEFTYPESSRVQSVIGDIRDRHALDRAMRGASVVVHCAAALPLNSEEGILTVDIDGTTHRMPWKQGALGLAKVFFR
jgi:nucleoside-diphosphate-sugar epimerase